MPRGPKLIIKRLIVCKYCLNRFGSTDCVERDIRLTDVRYSSPLLGRVEVCLGGEWGLVCSCPTGRDCNWKQENINTVCKQIGEKLGVIISSMYYIHTSTTALYQGIIEPPKAARGHTTLIGPASLTRPHP